jgi:transcriptional regulator with XRE-family HTH domain
MTLRERRLDARVTMEELAAAAGISVKTLYRIEAGAPTSETTVIKLARALDVDVVELAEDLGFDLERAA